jgi:uncharacterized protein (TIGR00369 family)
MTLDDRTYTAEEKAEFAKLFEAQGFMRFLGVEVVDIAPGRAELQVPFREELTQQGGFFHAGVTATLADNSGGGAAFTLAPEGAGLLTVEFKINLLRPAAGELMIARARVIKPGRRFSVAQSDVFVVRDGEEIHCATATGTFAYIDP